MASVLAVAAAFFPLDEQLALLPGHLTPPLHAWLVRLSAWMPFAQAASLLSELAHVPLSEGTAQRLTFAAGTTAVVQQTAAAQQIITTMPPPPVGPERLLLSVDGAMVPLLKGEWAEVKTLVVGEVTTKLAEDGTLRPQTSQLSSFSRLADAATFTTLATVETFARGIERAGAIVAVSDGAEWIQGFVDLHAPNAIRVLDFPHAAQRLSAIGSAVWGEGSQEAQAWQTRWRHSLKQDGPEAVLAAIEELRTAHPDNEALMEHAAYLAKRSSLMAYPAFQAALWPIGSGSVESANKLVVEARLKGAGMHWAREHVNPLLALRNIVCSNRWHQVWPQIAESLRAQARSTRRQRHLPRLLTPPVAPAPPACRAKTSAAGKAHPPTASHPWKRPTLPGGVRHNLTRRSAAPD
jgi:hypothetical protein